MQAPTWIVARFELGNSLRRVSTYIYFSVTFALTFVQFVKAADGFKSVSAVIGGNAANSAYVLYFLASGMTMFGIPVIAAIAAQSVCQDFRHKVYPLIFTSPISKRQLLLGRFVAAWTVVLFVFAAVPLGCLVGSFVPTADPELLVQNRLAAYCQPLLMAVLPNTFIFAAIFFAMAALQRNVMFVYASAALVLAAQGVAEVLLYDVSNEVLGSILDPFGHFAFAKYARASTIAERNVELVPITSVMLLNRFVWIVFGVSSLAVAVWRFRLQEQQQADGSYSTRCVSEVWLLKRTKWQRFKQSLL